MPLASTGSARHTPCRTPSIASRPDRPLGSIAVVADHPTLEATIGADGALAISADELSRVGVHPGDRVRVEPVARRRIRSMLGHGARPLGFTEAHLAELRKEMGEALGDDLTH